MTSVSLSSLQYGFVHKVWLLLSHLLQTLMRTFLVFQCLILSYSHSHNQEYHGHQQCAFHRERAACIRDALHISTYGDICITNNSNNNNVSEDDDDRQEKEETKLSTTCAICLGEVLRQDSVWELRNCSHVFHKSCLDRWLDHDHRLTCPLCRAPLLSAANYSADHQPSWAVDHLLYLFADDMLQPGHHQGFPASSNIIIQ